MWERGYRCTNSKKDDEILEKIEAITWLAVYGGKDICQPIRIIRAHVFSVIPLKSTNQKTRSLTFSTSSDLILTALLLGLSKLFFKQNTLNLFYKQPRFRATSLKLEWLLILVAYFGFDSENITSVVAYFPFKNIQHCL